MINTAKASEGPMEPMSKTALRQLRLKPTEGQLPVRKVYSRRRRDWIDLFDPSECERMKEPRAASEAQLSALAAGRRKLTHVMCPQCSSEIAKGDMHWVGLCDSCATASYAEEEAARERHRCSRLAELLGRGRSSAKTVFLDTETTGLEPSRDELLEVTLLDDEGAVLFSSLVKPTRQTAWPDAMSIHGIGPADVAEAPGIDEIEPALRDVLSDVDLIVAYNAPFDAGFMPPALKRELTDKLTCAMEAFALYCGIWLDDREDYKFHRLQIAAAAAGHHWSGSAHRAQPDAEACRAVWRFLLDKQP